MIENLVVAAIVAAAVAWLARSWIPAPLRARLGLGPARGCGGSNDGKKSACGKGDCGGCH